MMTMIRGFSKIGYRPDDPDERAEKKCRGYGKGRRSLDTVSGDEFDEGGGDGRSFVSVGFIPSCCQTGRSRYSDDTKRDGLPRDLGEDYE